MKDWIVPLWDGLVKGLEGCKISNMFLIVFSILFIFKQNCCYNEFIQIVYQKLYMVKLVNLKTEKKKNLINHVMH